MNHPENLDPLSYVIKLFVGRNIPRHQDHVRMRSSVEVSQGNTTGPQPEPAAVTTN